MSVIYIKDWIATNGAFIAGVLATNKLENPETKQWITNIFAEEPYTTNFYLTNIVQTEWVTNTVTMTNWSKFPVEHWYATPIPLWAVLLVIAALGIVIGIMMNAVKAIRPWYS